MTIPLDSGVILAPDAAVQVASMTRKRTPAEMEELIDLDFSDYGRAPRQGLGWLALAYAAAIGLLAICMWEPWR